MPLSNAGESNAGESNAGESNAGYFDPLLPHTVVELRGIEPRTS